MQNRRTWLQHLYVLLPFLLPFGNLANAAETYPLSYPPLVALKADSVKTLWAAASLPHIHMLLQVKDKIGNTKAARFWHKLAGLAQIDPALLLQTLNKHNARDLSLLILPPATAPHRAVFRAHIPGISTPGTIEEILDRLQLTKEWRRTESIGKTNAITMRFENKQSLCIVVRQDELILASHATVMKTYLDGDGGQTLYGSRSWQPSLTHFLKPESASLRLWLDLSWARMVACSLSPPPYDSILLDAQEELTNRNIPIPPALTFRLTPGKATNTLALSLPLTASVLSHMQQKKVVSIAPSDAFPPESDFVIALQRNAQGNPICPNATNVTPKSIPDHRPIYDLLDNQTPWNRILSLLQIVHSDTAAFLEKNMSALRMLTGLHPGRDFLNHAGQQFTWGTWRDESRTIQWALVLELQPDHSAPFARNVQQALLWARYFADKNSVSFETIDLPPTPHSIFTQEIHCNAWKLHAAVSIDNTGYVHIANTPATLAFIQNRITTLQPRPIDKTWLSWRCNMSPETRMHTAAKLYNRFVHPNENKEAWEDTLARAWVQTLLTQEQGHLVPTHNALSLTVTGEAIPIPSIATTLKANDILSGTLKPHQTTNATQVVPLLKFLFQAQQTYSHMRLSTFNGGTTPSYAQRLSDLIDGKSESGHSLTGFFDRQFPFEESGVEYTFSQLVRYLADSGLFASYYVQIPEKSANTVFDTSHDIAIVALPSRQDHDPALLLGTSGTLWWKRVPVTPDEELTLTIALRRLAIDSDPASTGWKRW